jgi:hypothetical protein
MTGKLFAATILWMLMALWPARIVLTEERCRNDFAHLMNTIVEGSTKDDVASILGQPDDVRTEFDPGGIPIADTLEIWRYGTSGHLTVATLGQVYFNDQGIVTEAYGKGEPPPVEMFEEQTLRRILQTLGAIHSIDSGTEFNPRNVIRAVNELQPLGKDRALAAISEYLRVSPPGDDPARDGVFLVLRVLFELPESDDVMPEIRIGAPLYPQPDDQKALPRFPIVIAGDIPFLIAQGFGGTGRESPENHVEYFREHGRLRACKLRPTDDPLAASDSCASDYVESLKTRSTTFGEVHLRGMLLAQVLKLVDTAYMPDASHDESVAALWSDATRLLMIRRVSGEAIRWDEQRQRYCKLDGSMIPSSEVRNYRRLIWRPLQLDLDISIIFERQSPNLVKYFVQVNSSEKVPSLVVSVHSVGDVNTTDASLSQIELPEMLAPGPSFTAHSSNVFTLEASKAITTHLEFKSTIYESPEMVP